MPLVRPVLIARDADKAYRTAYVRMKRTDCSEFLPSCLVRAGRKLWQRQAGCRDSNANLRFGNRSAVWQLRVGCSSIAAQQGPQRLIWLRAFGSAFGHGHRPRSLTSMSDSRFGPALIASASQ